MAHDPVVESDQLPSGVDISRVRGDTFPFVVAVKDEDGVAVDITASTFILTVDPSAAPVDDTNNLFQIAGVIVSGPAGTVSFTLTTPDADQTPATYYFDIQMTSGSAIRTIMKGKWKVVQDLTK